MRHRPEINGLWALAVPSFILFLMEQNGQPLYTDTNHLSRHGASLLREDFAPLFDP